MRGLPIAHLSLLGIGLLCAAICDLKMRRVPNVVTAFVLTAGIGFNWIDNGGRAALSGLGAAVLAILVLFGLWRARAIGGGDVKLTAAAAAWVGLPHFVWFILVTALAGGVVGVIGYLLARSSTRAEVRANLLLAGLHGQLPPVPSHRNGHPSVPYAVAIAAGSAVAILVA
jgi:prepilin peptidase CpaA